MQDKLIEQLKAGDEKAVAVWLRTHRPAIDRYVSGKVTGKADCDELVQEVFLACLRELAHFRGESALSTWMLTIAKHTVANFYRARYAKKVIHLVGMFEELGVDANLLEQDHVLAVRETLAKLPAQTQELLLAKYVDGKSISELAREFSKTTKAVESMLFRARHSFREAYTQ